MFVLIIIAFSDNFNNTLALSKISHLNETRDYRKKILNLNEMRNQFKYVTDYRLTLPKQNDRLQRLSQLLSITFGNERVTRCSENH